MADITSTSTFVDTIPNLNAKIVYVATPDTDGAGATVTIPDVAAIYMVVAVDASDNSAVACTVATNVVTITGDEANGVRMIVIGA